MVPATFNVIPPSPKDAIGGSQFARMTTNMTSAQRQEAALQELRRGNIPKFMRTFLPVVLTYVPDSTGETITAVIWVSPDYLSIGSDNDFLRIPLSYPSAVTIASELGCVLPTRKIVDAIYQQSFFHYIPQPLPPGPEMCSNNYFLRHQRKIEQQSMKGSLGKLVSGHKKDLVLTNRLWAKPGRVAIYGWHKMNEEPIQPLSTVHCASYADYSHGVRLVYQIALINGHYHSIYDVLEDSTLAPVLTYEGTIFNSRDLMTFPSLKQNRMAFRNTTGLRE
ncbi:MAG: hypothetical protein A2Y62_15785 [Candidatus Fischerbacteria bacterium RBG_13_37_8]|uniref:Uncharacterized protein n=1 Tax=Candidatus Fischerbacteria bacterium RBG_13_37_8 TaxID=1817863 RepID=A0A1F5VVP0_9BACT|nr:MAG: hypothetical protein A2Y62_15785 [Candidatus Fischerbacteria bacterium RBG_13_37_8]